MILIVTNKQDPHTDEVVRRLNGKKAEVFRLNTEDLGRKYKASLSVESSGKWSGFLTDELGRTVDIAKLRTAWIRRPEFPFERPENGEQAFIASELRALMSCFYALGHISFINDVFTVSKAKTKFQQLVNASKYGVSVPRTIITNDADAAVEFAKLGRGDIAIKSVHTSNFDYNGVKQGIQTRRVKRREFYEIAELVSNAPVQIQDYIEKDYELRVTVVGKKVFAVKIESQVNQETSTDWRFHTLMNPHSYVELSQEMNEFCWSFVESQGLYFGAIDFVVTPQGEHVFLENNPTGQYLWLEDKTDAPITDAVVDWLVSN